MNSHLLLHVCALHESGRVRRGGGAGCRLCCCRLTSALTTSSFATSPYATWNPASCETWRSSTSCRGRLQRHQFRCPPRPFSLSAGIVSIVAVSGGSLSRRKCGPAAMRALTSKPSCRPALHLFCEVQKGQEQGRPKAPQATQNASRKSPRGVAKIRKLGETKFIW